MAIFSGGWHGCNVIRSVQWATVCGEAPHVLARARGHAGFFCPPLPSVPHAGFFCPPLPSVPGALSSLMRPVLAAFSAAEVPRFRVMRGFVLGLGLGLGFAAEAHNTPMATPPCFLTISGSRKPVLCSSPLPLSFMIDHRLLFPNCLRCLSLHLQLFLT